MFFEPRGQLSFGEPSGGEIHHHRVCLLFAGNDLPSVAFEEDVHQDQGDSLIPINEWVVFAEMVSICSSFFKDSFVDKLAFRSHFRLSKCRLKHVSVSKPTVSTVTLQEIGVDR